MEVIEEVGYRPNLVARALKSSKTRTVGFIVNNIANPFYAEVLSGAEQVASEHGYSIIVCNTGQSFAKALEHLDGLERRRVDGVIYSCIGIESDATLAQRITVLQERGIGVVLLGRKLDGVIVDAVLCDVAEMTYTATRHILSLGHTAVAFVAGFRGTVDTNNRLQGYIRALTEAGITPQESRICYADYRTEGGMKAARELLDAADRPTAIVAANDLMAMGIMAVAKERGMHLPRDLAITGCDDIFCAPFLEPSLTTVRQPKYEMGKVAMCHLLDVLERRNPKRSTKTVLATELIVRASSGASLGAI